MYLTHGMSRHPAYAVWRAMVERCTLPRHPAWINYGGRGIKVCPRWLKFRNFWADMGDQYQPGLTLDRRNNHGGYSKENCRWVTYKVQNQNRRDNVWVQTPWGKLTWSEAARRTGVSRHTIRRRKASGWPESRWLEPPLAAYALIPTPWGPLTQAEAARRSGIGRMTLRARIKQGWPESRWLEPPRKTVDKASQPMILHEHEQTSSLSAKTKNKVVYRSHKRSNLRTSSSPSR